MVERVKDTSAMVAGMSPTRAEGRFVFCTVTAPDTAAAVIRDAVATVREEEGLSLILPVEVARDVGFSVDLPMAQITLQVHSALDGVGLTAAVATALADAGIACNMVAGYHHDHAFVPEVDAERAIAILKERAARAS